MSYLTIAQTDLTYYNISVHSNGSERKDRRKHSGALQQRHQVTHGSPKSPAVAVERIGHGHRHAAQAHQQVAGGQVADEEVCGVVEPLFEQDANQQEGVADTGDHHHHDVEGQEERFEVEQQLRPDERIQRVASVDALAFAVLQSLSCRFTAAVSGQAESLTKQDVHVSLGSTYGANNG